MAAFYLAFLNFGPPQEKREYTPHVAGFGFFQLLCS
ncbi:hypothetical protein BACCAP_04713 [Pseudoflavonifractor capillosus ATCC 29799]|uniref:Uncharacterized protein n=1 Tax=Pseudoflavonifractor capillosus ATCC 29799 TaxID=411467 RepID=A6P2I2_9FIRM|nr:hypothetical protein BACCAP_04713 [Pseudoflavonifractor capillosus ATCC 29799]